MMNVCPQLSLVSHEKSTLHGTPEGRPGRSLTPYAQSVIENGVEPIQTAIRQSLATSPRSFRCLVRGEFGPVVANRQVLRVGRVRFQGL